MKMIRKGYNIALIVTLIGVFLCGNFAYGSNDRLRTMIGQTNERMNEVLGLKYEFAEFKEIDENLYRGNLLIAGKIFRLDILKHNGPLFSLYNYTLYYQGEEVGSASWALGMHERNVPTFYYMKIKDKFRNDKLGIAKDLTKNVSVAYVLVNIIFKDISLEYGEGLSNIKLTDLMGFSPPDSKITSIFKNFGMEPLDIEKIKNNIEEGNAISFKWKDKEEVKGLKYPYFEIEENGNLYYNGVIVMLKKRGVKEAITDKVIYESFYNDNDEEFRNALIEIIEGRHIEYEAYVGGTWGLKPDKIDWLKEYVDALPSWQTSLTSGQGLELIVEQLKYYINGVLGIKNMKTGL